MYGRFRFNSGCVFESFRSIYSKGFLTVNEHERKRRGLKPLPEDANWTPIKRLTYQQIKTRQDKGRVTGSDSRWSRDLTDTQTTPCLGVAGRRPYHHCVFLCMHRAYLCGTDSITGQSYENRH